MDSPLVCFVCVACAENHFGVFFSQLLLQSIEPLLSRGLLLVDLGDDFSVDRRVVPCRVDNAKWRAERHGHWSTRMQVPFGSCLDAVNGVPLVHNEIAVRINVAT